MEELCKRVLQNLTVRSTMSGKERINVGILKIWKFNWRFYLEDSLKKFSKKVDFSGFFTIQEFLKKS